MKYIDLKSQYCDIQNSLHTRIQSILKHGQYIMGPEVIELEGELALYTGSKDCITCSSGTDALLMSLMVQGTGPGDAVFTTPFTFIATAEVIQLLGATLHKTRKNNYNFQSVNLKAGIKVYDMLILVTDHDKYDYDILQIESQLIVDTRGKLDHAFPNVIAA